MDSGFEEKVYADDLNAYKEYPMTTGSGDILAGIELCQHNLHEWGKSCQVTFDAGKEHFAILYTVEPHGELIKLLGVSFDPKLQKLV